MIRRVFIPTFGNICDWECSHCGYRWEASSSQDNCPSCQLEDQLNYPCEMFNRSLTNMKVKILYYSVSK